MPDLFSIASEEAQSRRLQMLRTAFGPAIAAALDDPQVIEIMVNPDGRLWLDKAGTGRIETAEHIGMAEAERIIRLVAAHVRREVHDLRKVGPAEQGRGGVSSRVRKTRASTRPVEIFSRRNLASPELGGDDESGSSTRRNGRSAAARWP